MRFARARDLKGKCRCGAGLRDELAPSFDLSTEEQEIWAGHGAREGKSQAGVARICHCG